MCVKQDVDDGRGITSEVVGTHVFSCETQRSAVVADLGILCGDNNAGELRMHAEGIERVSDKRLAAKGVQVLARYPLRPAAGGNDHKDVVSLQRFRH